MKSAELVLSPSAKDWPLAARMFMGMCSQLSAGCLQVADPAGHTHCFGETGAEPHATLHIVDWRACNLILRQGDIGFAEAYRRGWVHCNDLLSLFTLALRNEDQVNTAINGHWWALLAKRIAHLLLRDNNRRGSRRNIHKHYDIGNPFYRLWLDPSMSYSAALYEGDPQRSLEDAQWVKVDRILDELDAQPGQTVLEIGCGWGGFAERAAQRGLKVHGITLSTEQLAYATERMQRAGLQDAVTLSLTDYRDVAGRYDHVVSIEMFEAVGERWWPTYFAKVASCLKPGGRAVIQTISMDDAHFADYRRGTDFIQQYIFPGGMLPSPREFALQADRAGLQILTRKEFGLDYARTLQAWRESFEARLDEVRRLGLDEAFIRIWRMYLVYCEAGFRAGRTDVGQWTLAGAV